MTIIRTKRLGCFVAKQHAFGGYFLPVDDPEASLEIEEEDFKRFHVRPDFPRIPADLWNRWARLCIDLAKRKSELEVSMRILRADDDLSKYRIVIPMQSVSGGHVDADFDHSRDIETGEDIGLYPPPGWHGIGSCHSHHTMAISFSSGDDTSELNDPGLHLLIRKIDTFTQQYVLDASITTNKRRFLLDWPSVVDARPVPGADYHPDVLKNIVTEPAAPAVRRYWGTNVRYDDTRTVNSLAEIPLIDKEGFWYYHTINYQPIATHWFLADALRHNAVYSVASGTNVTDAILDQLPLDVMYAIVDDCYYDDLDYHDATDINITPKRQSLRSDDDQDSPGLDAKECSLAESERGQRFICSSLEDLHELLSYCKETGDEPAINLIQQELQSLLDLCSKSQPLLPAA